MSEREAAKEAEEEVEDSPESAPRGVLAGARLNVVLFLATIASTLYVGRSSAHWLSGWKFALPFLAILVTHEAGHYLYARRHRVEASLPYFIPFPLSMIGTFGAVIAMRGRIRTRNALFDIGASGPIAGLIVAIPVLAYGLHLSPVEPIGEHGTDEGQSLFYWLMKRLVLGPIPPGHDVFLHPTAFAGWAGLLMTMLNLVPSGQLDGGHVAYALFGERQQRHSRIVRWSLLAVALVVVGWLGFRQISAHAPLGDVLSAMGQGMTWAVWSLILWWMSRRAGHEHPPTEESELSPGRRVMAWGLLVMFVALFMPVVMSSH